MSEVLTAPWTVYPVSAHLKLYKEQDTSTSSAVPYYDMYIVWSWTDVETVINKYNAVKKLKNWHSKYFYYLRGKLLSIWQITPDICGTKRELKSRKVWPLFHSDMLRGFLSFHIMCSQIILQTRQRCSHFAGGERDYETELHLTASYGQKVIRDKDYLQLLFW